MARLTAPLVAGLAAVGGCVFVLLADPTTPGGITPPCPTRTLLGVDCPGCGSARMLFCLLHGDLTGALRFNTVGVLGVALLIWSYAGWGWSRATGRRMRDWQQWRWAPVAVAITLGVWFVARMLPMEPFRSLQV